MSADEQEARSWSVDLGSVDCEYCGGTAEELVVEEDEDRPGFYDVRLSVGCYGGRSEYGLTAQSAAEFVEELRREFDLRKQRKAVGEILTSLRAIAEKEAAE